MKKKSQLLYYSKYNDLRLKYRLRIQNPESEDQNP